MMPSPSQQGGYVLQRAWKQGQHLLQAGLLYQVTSASNPPIKIQLLFFKVKCSSKINQFFPEGADISIRQSQCLKSHPPQKKLEHLRPHFLKKH